MVVHAQRFAAARRRVRLLGGGSPADPPTLRVHPALSGAGADPARQGWQLAEEAARRIDRASHSWLQDDLATVVEDVFDIDVAVVQIPGWFDGAAWSEQGVRVAVVGATRRPGRQRFALAHQVCHLLAGEIGDLHVDASIEQIAPERAHTEIRANAFAEAFLMPLEVLRERTPQRWTPAGFASLATWLGLPAQVVAGRLYRVGLISPADRCRYERLHGTELAALAGAGEEYAQRCRRAARTRLPARLVQDAARLGLPPPTPTTDH
jgi:Zn-dependent peptidase ImmA (M78 family)